jgi:hypothetical protein
VSTAKHVTLVAVFIAGVVIAGAAPALVPRANAMPAPEVEYVYDVVVRRHYNFANPDDAVKYGYRICDKVSQGESYAQVMADVKTDVLPNDEFAANYQFRMRLTCCALHRSGSCGTQRRATNHQDGSRACPETRGTWVTVHGEL